MAEATEQPVDQLLYIEEWLCQRLLVLPTVATIIGQKIYPVGIPANEPLPAITYARSSTQRLGTQQRGGDGIARPVFQITVWVTGPAEFRSQALPVAAEIAALINKGICGKFAGIRIQAAKWIDELDVVAAPAHGDDLVMLGRRIIVELAHDEG